MKSVARSLVARWGWILLASILGGLIAHTVVQDTNEGIKPTFRAEAAVVAVSVDGDGRDSGTDLDEEQADALELAEEVNSSALLFEGNSVTANPNDGSLIFTSIGQTPESAKAQAEQMRAAYVAADESFSSAAQLEENRAEAEKLTERLEELTPTTTVVTVPPKTPDQVAAAAVLDARESAIRGEIATVTAALLDANEAGDTAAAAGLEDRLSELEEMLAAILIEKDSTETADEASEPGQSAGEDSEPDVPMFDMWAIQAIENRLTELQDLTGPVIVGEITGNSLDLSEAVVVDETPSPLSMAIWFPAGVLAGALLGAALVLMRDRSMGIIWHSRDLAGIRVLGEGPAEPETAVSSSPKLSLRRRRLIQTVRSAILSEPSRFNSGSIVGFSAVPSTSPQFLSDLSYEVGSSMAWVGRSVLIINVGFSSLERQGQTTRGGSHLHKLVGRLSDGELSIDERVTDVLRNASSVTPGLDLLSADLERFDPVDLLDGKPFRRLIERSGEVYDIVILVTPSGEVASTARIASNFQQEVIVATLGSSSLDEVESEFGLESQHLGLLRGVVILRRKGLVRRTSNWIVGSALPWLRQNARRMVHKSRQVLKRARSFRSRREPSTYSFSGRMLPKAGPPSINDGDDLHADEQTDDAVVSGRQSGPDEVD